MAKTTENFKATCSKAYGQDIETFSFDFEATQYGSYDDMVAANDLFKPAQLLTLKNAELRNAARASKQEDELTSRGFIKPTTENSAQLRLKEMYIILRQSSKTHDEAVKLSALNVGEEWEKTPEDGSIKFAKGK